MAICLSVSGANETAPRGRFASEKRRFASPVRERRAKVTLGPSPIPLQLAQDHGDLLVGLGHQRDARRAAVAAAAIAGRELADVGPARTAEDAVAEQQHGKAAVRPPMDARRDVDLRKQRVDQEAVADRRVIEIPEVGDHHVAVDAAVAAQLLAEALVLTLQQLAALLHGGILEDGGDRRLAAQQLDEVQEVALEGAEPAAAV